MDVVRRAGVDRGQPKRGPFWLSHAGNAMPSPTAPTAIEIKVDEVSQLFNTLDPFPFRERDLDKDAEDFIVGWARELHRRADLRIVIHVPEPEARKANVSQVTEALQRYFDYRAGALALELKELFRVGRLSLLIGLFVLALCLLLSQAVESLPVAGQIHRYLEEGLIILGWVANWKPIEVFLYEWWPLAQRRNLYRRLGKATVSVQADKVEDSSTAG